MQFLHLRTFVNIISIRLKVNEHAEGSISTILLTGGTGFIGNHTAEYFLRPCP
jgi:hypothetical protein